MSNDDQLNLINGQAIINWIERVEPTLEDIVDAIRYGRFETYRAGSGNEETEDELGAKTRALEAVERICSSANAHTMAAKAYYAAHSVLERYKLNTTGR